MATFTQDEYSAFHNALTDAYYSGTPFVWRGVSLGVLSLEAFEAWHTLCWAAHDYEWLDAEKTELRDAARVCIELRRAEGYELPDLKAVVNG